MKACCCLFFMLLMFRVNGQDLEFSPVERSSGFRIEAEEFDTAGIMRKIREIEQWQRFYPDSAIFIYRQIFGESRQIDFPEGIIQSVQHQGALYASQGKFAESENMFRNAYAICSRSEKLWKCLPVIYNGIATIYETLGNYRQAADYYYQAVVLAEKSGLPSSAGLYNNLGAVLISLEQFEEAFYYLDRAEKIASGEGYPNPDILSSIMNNKGLIWLVRKNWSQSRRYFTEALRLSRKQKSSQSEYMALMNMGTLSQWQDKPEEALEWFAKTAQVEGVINPHFRNTALQNMGKAWFTLHDYEKAESCFLRALDTAKQLSLMKRVMELQLQLSEVYEAQGRYKQSLALQKAYSALKDSISGKEIINNIQSLNVKFRTSEKDKEISQKEMVISTQEVSLKKKNLWIGGIASGTLLLSGLLIVLIWTSRQRHHLHTKQIQILLQQQQIGRLNAIMQGEEKERTRIARELHDGIGGMLAAVKMNFTTLQHQYRQYADAYDFIRPSDFNEIRNMLDEAGNEIRKTAHNLMPDILVRHGLYEALKVYCDQVNTGSQLYVNFQASGSIENIHSSFALSLYRIVQELVQNVLKHAGASNVLIQISRNMDNVRLVVKDNGKGFDLDVSPGGIGLENIRFRVQALQGDIAIHSRIGSGTRIEMDFNLQKINHFRPNEYQDSHS